MHRNTFFKRIKATFIVHVLEYAFLWHHNVTEEIIRLFHFLTISRAIICCYLFEPTIFRRNVNLIISISGISSYYYFSKLPCLVDVSMLTPLPIFHLCIFSD